MPERTLANIVASLEALAHRLDEHNPDARYVPLGTAIQAARDAYGLAAADAEDAALALMHAVGAFLERGNPTEAADNREQLKAAYMDAQCALIRTDNA